MNIIMILILIILNDTNSLSLGLLLFLLKGGLLFGLEFLLLGVIVVEVHEGGNEDGEHFGFDLKGIGEEE